MKKAIALVLSLVLALGMVACGNSESGEATTTEAVTEAVIENLTGTMEEVIAAINEKHAAVELPLMTMALDLTDLDTVTYNTGLTSVDNVTEIAISEPMMGQPYSLVLVRAKDAAAAEAIAQEMYEKVDTRKWVCMEADTKVAASHGDVAMFFMVSSDFADQVTTATMLDAFKAVCAAEVVVVG